MSVSIGVAKDARKMRTQAFGGADVLAPGRGELETIWLDSRKNKENICWGRMQTSGLYAQGAIKLFCARVKSEKMSRR